MSDHDELEVRVFDGPLGAEVFGVEPTADLTPNAFASIEASLRRHKVLLFRGAIRTNERLTGFARRFGELFRFFDDGTEPGFPEILRVSNLEENGKPIGLTGTMELPWHTDYANQARPAKESFLEAGEVPGGGAAATSFIDMYAAWETLPASLRTAIDGKLALHRPKAEYDLTDSTSATTQAQRNAIQTAHPITVRHPETNRVALYVSPVETTEIVGASDARSREIFEQIFDHVIRPENIYRHEWLPGDLMVFDAIGTMHHREAFAAGMRRFMKQLSTRCERPLQGAEARV